MTYWRMQLHPNEPERSAEHAARCLSRGVIGLDFRENVGDLRSAPELETGQHDYRMFYSDMKVGDAVLIQSHHHPFALVEIASDYAFVPDAPSHYGVWFRHLRLVRNVLFYFDWITNPAAWARIPMTDTIARLKSVDGQTYQLIRRWLEETSNSSK